MSQTTSELPIDMDHMRVRVLTDRCAGCQECVIRCPSGALSMDTGRWVALADESLCVGCRQCVRTCPFSAIVVDGPLLVAPRIDLSPQLPEHLLGDSVEVHPGYSSWPEALAEADRCLTCPDPTCVRGCPTHNDIPRFISAIRNRDLQGAHAILRTTSVLPDVCSRVCNQAAQCEGACSWSLAGGTPVAIGRLERFVTDTLPVPSPAPPLRTNTLSVGIVGAGPAGLSAAWELIEAGASVVVYEKEDTPGGLCNWGIPDFTLPEAISSRSWNQLVEAGLDLRCRSEIHPENIDELLATHDAVIMAHGASLPLHISVPGVELDGITDATSFLQGAKVALKEGGDAAAFCRSVGVTGKQGELAPRVLVLGAGNTAMDVARTALRLGLKATCIDWLDERFALARPEELEEARHEGVDVRFQRTLIRLDGEGNRIAHAQLACTTQSKANEHPKVLTTSTENIDISLVVMAMGYRIEPTMASALSVTPVRRVFTGIPDRRWIASGILAGTASAYANSNPVGTLALGREVGIRAAALPVRERLWIVGDALVGPSTVVEAMAQGRRAAYAVLDSIPSTSENDLSAVDMQKVNIEV